MADGPLNVFEIANVLDSGFSHANDARTKARRRKALDFATVAKLQLRDSGNFGIYGISHAANSTAQRERKFSTQL